MKFKIHIDSEHCKGCELCVSACPRSVLKMSRALSSQGYNVVVIENPEACLGCGQCADVCPDAAIEIERGDG